MSIQNSQNNDSVEPYKPLTPLGSGGMTTHKHYWDIRRKEYDNRTNE